VRAPDATRARRVRSYGVTPAIGSRNCCGRITTVAAQYWVTYAARHVRRGGHNLHEFDFWIGDWEVFGPQGKQVGANTITAMFGNGTLLEHRHGNGGIEGRSLTVYDEARGVWHQTWIDSTGGVLLLDGGLQGAGMVMAGRAPSGDDPTAVDVQRITWKREADGLRQVWETSTDDGATWKIAFDGRYRRVWTPR
jgi:hypothetical protein